MKEITRTDWSALPAGYLSPSSVWGYLACPYCWYWERVEHIPKPVSVDLLVGRWSHVSVADMRRRLIEDLTDDIEASVEVGAQEFETILTEQSYDEDGEAIPIEIELTKKFANLDEAKDSAARLTRYVLPLIAAYDRKAGIAAYEARVRHLGPSFVGYPDLLAKLSEDERLDAEEEGREQFVGGVAPVFPFPMKAFLDVLYTNGVLKDLKTSSRNGAPDALATLQLLIYGLPWHVAEAPLKLGFDVAVKTSNPAFAVYWLNGTGDVTPAQYEYARDKVLWVADQICEGNFPVNEGSLWHKYEHGLPKGERAAMGFEGAA